MHKPCLIFSRAPFAGIRSSLLAILLLISLPVFAAAPVMLANSYRPGIPLGDYWISEKLDGVRAYWDGSQLFTRAGNRIPAPPWFTAGWPSQPLDGELWAGRGRFDQVSSTVRQLVPEDAEWRSLHFMVFDLPAHPGAFSERLQALQHVLRQKNLPQVKLVQQFRVANEKELMHLLDVTGKAGGEGLMLHRGKSLYRAERSNDLLKLKKHDDAEARVIAHLPGKGKYTGMTGALLVETPEGLRFRLGSGLSDAQRHMPPALGSMVTYRYRGLHASGIPRFATFLRVREAGL